MTEQVAETAGALQAEARPGFVSLAVKTVVCHTVTYMVMGALAYHFLNYAAVIKNPYSLMKPVTSYWVIFGAPLQVFRGVLFASVFYLFRGQLFRQKNGWLRMAWLLIGIGILGTFAAPPGSLEGFIYRTFPMLDQVRGYLEIVPQALLLSGLLTYWVNHAGKKWLSWTLGVLYALCLLLPAMALVAPKRG